MPLRLDIKRKLSARSDRVKCVDLHPSEPWMLASLYNGNVHIWNLESQQLIKSFEVCDLPVRAARFVSRKNWIITGSDDMQIRVFNYNTLERVFQFEAHSDYVRSIAVHPTQPYILTSSDDMLIKLWDWEKKWACTQVFEGHTHYVMQIVINPKDNNTFASASLDRTVKVWQLGSPTPNFTLEGHEKGVNCVDYYSGGDKPYLISGADDRLVKIWDYQNKTCVQTLEGHAQNLSAVAFHPELPIIMTGSEDGTVRIWHANTYRLESTLNYGLERVWTISCQKGSNNVALGYDEGSIIVKLGREEPAMSMDMNGKIIWAKHSEIQQANIKAIGDQEIRDGERLPLAVKDMGSCEVYPQTIQHNPNGRFVVVCGDGEYIIYTAMALRNKSFGSAQEFVWSNDSAVYAIRESNSLVKISKNFKEQKSFKPDFGAEGIYGGHLLGVRSVSGLAFYEWETTDLIRRIEITPKHIYWSDNGELVCISTEESFFILKYFADAFEKAKETKEGVTEDGIEEAFEVVGEIEESVRTGLWVGDCFIYTNSVNRLNYYVGGEIVTIAHLDRVMYLLGYIPKDNRLYLGDKELNVVSYSLLLSVLEYQTVVMRRDFETADKVLPTIPREQRTRVAHFLEKQGFKSQALAVTCDPEHKFELALQLGDLRVAYQLAKEAESEQKWKLLAELAISKCEFGLAQECLHQAQDFGGLLLLATSAGNTDMVLRLGQTAEKTGQNNVAFLSYFSLGKLDECLEVLINTGRLPEAAFFARTYLPSQISRVVKLWREMLSKINKRAADSLADPTEYENLFPGLRDTFKTEQFLKPQYTHSLPAGSYAKMPMNTERNPIEEMLKAETEGTFVYRQESEDGDEYEDAPTTTKDEVLTETPEPLPISTFDALTSEEPKAPSPLPAPVDPTPAEPQAALDLQPADPEPIQPTEPLMSTLPDEDKPSSLEAPQPDISDANLLTESSVEELSKKESPVPGPLDEEEKTDSSKEISAEPVLSKQAVSDLEKELELDLENLVLDNVDTTDLDLEAEDSSSKIIEMMDNLEKLEVPDSSGIMSCQDVPTAVEDTPLQTITPPTSPVPEASPVIPESSLVPEDSPVIPESSLVPEDSPVISESSLVPEDSPVISESSLVPEDSPVIPESSLVPEDSPVIPEPSPVPEASPVIPEPSPVPEASPVIPEPSPVPEASPVIPESSPVPEASPIIPESSPVVSEASPIIPESSVPEASPVIPEASAVSESSIDAIEFDDDLDWGFDEDVELTKEEEEGILAETLGEEVAEILKTKKEVEVPGDVTKNVDNVSKMTASAVVGDLVQGIDDELVVGTKDVNLDDDLLED